MSAECEQVAHLGGQRAARRGLLVTIRCARSAAGVARLCLGE